MDFSPLLERALAQAEGRHIPTVTEVGQRTIQRPPRNYLDAILLAKRADLGLETLKLTGALQEILPEIHPLVGFGGGKEGHKDLWEHVKQVVVQTPGVSHLRWTALFHDVGKVRCFKREEGKVSFHGHEVASARIWGKFCHRTAWFSSPFASRVGFLIGHLGHIESYESSWTDSAVRRLNLEVGDNFADLVALSRADMTTADPRKRAKNQQRIDELVGRVQDLSREAARPKPRKGLGLELGEALGLTPGPALGRVMKTLTEAIQTGELAPDAPIKEYLSWLVLKSKKE